MLSCQNEEASELLGASKKKFLMLKISFLSLVLARCRQADEPPGVNFIKPFSPSSLMTRPNKLEGLSLETLSSQVLEFVDKARANPIGGPFRCFLLGQAPGVTRKC